jgi:dipeptidyl aminopeptidase/acylaminoacyl peptidase
MKRLLRWTLLVLAIVVVLFVAGSWLSARLLTEARPNVVGAPPSDFPNPAEAVTFTTSDDHALSGWFVPADKSDKGIVLLHGYGGTRKQMLPRAHAFRAQGYNVLLYDARACGESSGDQISFGFSERHDLIAAVKLLKERGCKEIACLGVSQGGATILFTADDLPDLKCAICESVYDEMAHAVDRRLRYYTGMPGWLGASLMVPFAEQRIGLSIDDVKPVEHVGKLRCPVFVISGERDDKTWPEDTQRLFDAARAPKELWMIPDARHEDLFRFPGYEEKTRDFLKRYLD